MIGTAPSFTLTEPRGVHRGVKLKQSSFDRPGLIHRQAQAMSPINLNILCLYDDGNSLERPNFGTSHNLGALVAGSKDVTIN